MWIRTTCRPVATKKRCYTRKFHAIVKQLEYEHIPVTIEPHTIIVDEGGPVEGTPFIAPPEKEVTHTTMTAPLSQTIIESILADDKLIFKGSSKLQQAYDAWYIDNMKRCTQR